MQHRHLIPRVGEAPSLAEIDDVMERGTMADWIDLGRLALRNEDVLAHIERVASHTSKSSERPERPAFWLLFCERLGHPRDGVER